MKKAIISERAYLSMLAEVYEHIKTETGGIFLGHRENDTWYIIESIDPGWESKFTPVFFEYDEQYITYRANKQRRLYKNSLKLLGLWHRHPGMMKIFQVQTTELIQCLQNKVLRRRGYKMAVPCPRFATTR